MAMHPEGRVYISLSGLHSKLADEYEGAHKLIKDRFNEVSELCKTIYHITEKVCLYTEEEAARLLHDARFTILESRVSDFGNIKIVGSV
jgi:hypothetical protein